MINMIFTLFLISLVAANAAVLSRNSEVYHSGGRTNHASTPHFDPDPVAWEAVINVNVKATFTGPQLGDTSFFPTGPSGDMWIQNDIAQFEWDEYAFKGEIYDDLQAASAVVGTVSSPCSSHTSLSWRESLARI